MAAGKVTELRAAGERVIIDYLGESAEALNCDRELVMVSGEWQLVPFK